MALASSQFRNGLPMLTFLGSPTEEGAVRFDGAEGAVGLGALEEVWAAL
ncbi:hypothetical protein P3G55_23390 [Leptospira sp. 96542]|nr:hypothetical protein [Leptospira sp. 96542]